MKLLFPRFTNQTTLSIAHHFFLSRKDECLATRDRLLPPPSLHFLDSLPCLRSRLSAFSPLSTFVPQSLFSSLRSNMFLNGTGLSSGRWTEAGKECDAFLPPREKKKKKKINGRCCDDVICLCSWISNLFTYISLVLRKLLLSTGSKLRCKTNDFHL